MKRIALAALLVLGLTRCSDAPVQPDAREHESLRAALVPQPGGLYCTEPDAQLSSATPSRPRAFAAPA